MKKPTQTDISIAAAEAAKAGKVWDPKKWGYVKPKSHPLRKGFKTMFNALNPNQPMAITPYDAKKKGLVFDREKLTYVKPKSPRQ